MPRSLCDTSPAWRRTPSLKLALLTCVSFASFGCIDSPNSENGTRGDADIASRHDEPAELPSKLPADQVRVIREHFPDYTTPLPEPPVQVEGDEKTPLPATRQRRIEGQPLLTAINNGDVANARQLIASAETRDAIYDGYNMLHMAAKAGKAEICAMLLDAGLDVDQVDNNEYSVPRTPIQMAIQRGSVETVKLLLERGAKLTPALGSRKRDGSTVSLASLAVTSQNSAMLKFLMEHSVPVEDNRLVLNAISGIANPTRRTRMVEQLFSAGLTLDGLNAPFVSALQTGDLSLVKLLETKGSPNFGEEHLTAALQAGQIDMCRYVVANGGKLSSDSPHDDLMRMALIDHRSPELVELITEAGGMKAYSPQSEGCMSYCNRRDFAHPLYHAVMENDLEFCRYLIREFSDDDGLWAALKYEPYEYESDIEFFQKGNSVLFSAVFKDNADAMKLLLKYTQPPHSGEQPLVDINAQNWAGNTVLHEAVNFGAVRCVQLLLAAGADPSIARNDGLKPVHIATRHHQTPHSHSHKRMEEAAAIILPMLVAANVVQSESDWIDDTTAHESTALHTHAGAGYPENCRKLIELGADVNAVDKNQRTPLHYAIAGSHAFHPGNVRERYVQTCMVLLQNGTKLNQEDAADHLNYLRHAAAKGLYEVFDELLSRGAKKDIKKHAGHLLCSAAQHDNPDRIKQLLEWGSDVNAHGYEDSTALHHAARRKNLEVCQLLISNGADVNAVDERGQTPLFEVFDRWALHLERFLVASPDETQDKAFAVLQLLLRHGADPTVEASSTTSTSFSGTVLDIYKNMPPTFREALTAEQ